VQVASALVAAHAANVVHPDATPANILIAEDGTAKVADYDISVWRAAAVTSNDNINGTMAYVSPEVANGEGAKPADIFLLGATLYAAVEGGPPFGTGHPAAILTRIRDNRMEPMRNAGPPQATLGTSKTRCVLEQWCNARVCG
jgi:serine/threonine protein kinase